MTAWRMRTVTDDLGWSGLKEAPDHSHDPGTIREMWQLAIDEFGLGRAEVASTDGRLLVDLRFVDGHWWVLGFGRGKGFGAQGLLQLAQAPSDVPVHEVWARAHAARDDRGWLSASGLGRPARSTRPGAASGALLGHLLSGEDVIAVPGADVVDAVGGALWMLPEHLARRTVWSTGHLPASVPGRLVTGDLSELDGPASEEWQRVQAALARQRATPGDGKVVTWLLGEAGLGRCPAAEHDEAADFSSLAQTLERQRPRLEAEKLADLGLRPYDARRTWGEPVAAFLERLHPKRLQELVVETPMLGMRMLTDAPGPLAESAFANLLSGCLDRDPFGLATGRPSRSAARLLSRLESAERHQVLLRAVDGARLDEDRLRSIAEWLELCGVTAATTPDLFPFDRDAAVRLVAALDTRAFVDLMVRAGRTADDVVDAVRQAMGELRPPALVAVLDACYRGYLLRNLDDIRRLVRGMCVTDFHLQASDALGDADRDVAWAVLDVLVDVYPAHQEAYVKAILGPRLPPGLRLVTPEERPLDVSPASIPSSLVVESGRQPAPRAPDVVRKPRPPERGNASVEDPAVKAHSELVEPDGWSWAARDRTLVLDRAVLAGLVCLTGALVSVLVGAAIGTDRRPLAEAGRPQVPTAVTSASTKEDARPQLGFILIDRGASTVEVIYDPVLGAFSPGALPTSTEDIVRIMPAQPGGRLPPVAIDGHKVDRPDGFLVRFERARTFVVTALGTARQLQVTVRSPTP